MEQACHLAGFFAAHAIWSVSDGETLIPILATETTGGERSMMRLVDEDLAAAVGAGHERQDANPEGHARSVLLHDAYLHLDDHKVDAVIAHLTDHDTGARLVIGIPYRPAEQGFAVHRVKFLEADGVDEATVDQLGQAFFVGVEAHEQGAAVWNEHLDESV
jgi:hypothetical protein